jgi:beta-glucanase (GH16 family)
MTSGEQAGPLGKRRPGRRGWQGSVAAAMIVGLLGLTAWFDSSKRGRTDGGLVGSVGGAQDSAAESASPTGDPVPPGCVQSEAGGVVWELVAADDFEGTALDTASWYPYDSEGNAGFGLRSPDAITVAEGRLLITAQMIEGQLVSGGMAHSVGQVYGRWEFRVRTDPDPTAATSGVVLTWPDSGDWPIDGENDMYETGTVAERQPFYTFIHYGADNDQEALTHQADGTEWHEVAMEWTADRIAMYVDGEPAGEITNAEAIPYVAHHMTVQLDAWADTMGDPVQMEVDWIRVYQLSDAGQC